MKSKNLLRTLLLLILEILWLPAVQAQQDAPPVQGDDKQPPKPAAATPVWMLPGQSDSGEDQTQAVPVAPPSPYAGTLKDVGTGLPLLGTSRTPLRWGSFSIYQFESIGIYDHLDITGNPSPTIGDIAIFRTGIMFDHSAFGKGNRIILEYLPQMMIFNGDIHANGAANNNVSTGMQFELTSRLRLTIGDTFTQVHDNSLLPLNYLTVDSQLGSIAQNDFQNTNGNFLADTAYTTFDYAVSPRTTISFSPSFRYMQTLNAASNYSANGEVYTGTVSVGHALTPRRSVGIAASYQYLEATIGGVPQNATYYTLGAFYSEQLARTFWVTANVGATNQHYTQLAQSGGWDTSASVSVTKALPAKGTLALAYTRGMIFDNYVTRQRSDRTDGTFGIGLSPRVTWHVSGGYQRGLGGGGTSNLTNGKYGTSDLTYRFYGDFSMFTAFTYAFQRADTSQLLSGDRKTVVYGIRWSPDWMSSRR